MRIRLSLAASLIVTATWLGACGSGDAPTSPAPAANPEAVYALGMLTAHGLRQMQLSPAERAEFERGMRDYAGGSPRVPLVGELNRLQSFQTERMSSAVERERLAGEETLRAAASEPGAEQLPSGIVIQSLQAGTGESPKPGDVALVNGEGSLPDGTVFLSAKVRERPLSIEMTGGLPCLTESLPRMAVGGRARITCPAYTGYSQQDRPLLVVPGAALRFEIELLQVKPSGASIHRQG